MRILGPLFVIASLVLGAGGVAYRTHATEAREQFGMTPLPVAREARECAAPEPVRVALPRRPANANVLGLSTRGYNYRAHDRLEQARQPAPSLPASPR